MPGALTPTAQMWFYEQERRRWDDPKQAVRRKAEFKAAQRRQRIEARRWYGYSNMRPQANVTPMAGHASRARRGHAGRRYGRVAGGSNVLGQASRGFFGLW